MFFALGKLGYRLLARFLRDEDGSWLILTSVMMPVLIGVAGLGTVQNQPEHAAGMGGEQQGRGRWCVHGLNLVRRRWICTTAGLYRPGRHQ